MIEIAKIRFDLNSGRVNIKIFNFLLCFYGSKTECCVVYRHQSYNIWKDRKPRMECLKTGFTLFSAKSVILYTYLNAVLI